MSEIKVLSYNILDGLQHSQMLIDVFVEWVKRQDPDITFYQELAEWSEKRFAELAQRCGHPYSAKIKEDGWRMGISSKEELCDVQCVTEGFTWGYVYAKVQDYHLFAIHLSPFAVAQRIAEIEQILAHVKSLPNDAPVMIVGDFNSLAESDKDAYEEMPQDQRFIDKWQLHDGEVAFQVTNTLIAAGMTDAFKLFHYDFKKSHPTPKLFSPGNTDTRIDYAFLSPALKDKCTSAEFVCDPITHYLSDHYPLVFTLRKSRTVKS